LRSLHKKLRKHNIKGGEEVTVNSATDLSWTKYPRDNQNFGWCNAKPNTPNKVQAQYHFHHSENDWLFVGYR